MIEVQQLTKRYGDRIAVDDLSFTVRPGVVTGFLGPNGSGKSTTMRMIMGLDEPTSGQTLINGATYSELRWPLREIGALLDAKAIHPSRSAFNHLWMLAQTNDIPRTRVSEVLDLVGLRDVARERAGKFSLGMSQRLGIAAVLLGDPGVMLFDEPINGLDPEGISWGRTLLKGLAAEGRTVLVSSHLMSEMALTAQDLVVIGRGALISAGPTDDFIRQNSEQSVRVATPTPGRLRIALRAAGAMVRDDTENALHVTGLTAAMVGDIAGEHHITVHELTTQHASLEDAFMGLTDVAIEYRGITTMHTPEKAGQR